jgi:hypothetical protein
MAEANEDASKPLGGGAASHEANDYLSAGSNSAYGYNTPGTPGLTRTASSDSGDYDSYGNDNFPPLDRLASTAREDAEYLKSASREGPFTTTKDR